MPLRLPLPLAAAGTPAQPLGGLLRNAAWLMFDRGFRFAAVFATGVMVTRHLGPTGAGTLGNALALAAILAGLCDLGLDSIVRLEVIAAPADRGRVLGTATVLRLAAAPLAFLVFAWALSRDPAGFAQPGLLLGVGLTLLFPGALILDSWFQSQTQARYSVWGQTAGLTVGAALRVAGVAAGASLSWFGWSAGLELVVSAGFLFVLYRIHAGPGVRWRYDRRMARQLLARAWPLALTNFAILIYTRIDIVLLTQLRNEHEVGLYAAATRLTEAGYILPMIAVNTLFPLLARQHLEDRGQFSRTLHRLLVGVAWTGLATALFVSCTAPYLVRFLYGPAFAGTAAVLTISGWNCVFAGLGAVRAQWLVLNHLQRFGLYYVLMGVGLNLALNALLIPRLGALGAATASLGTQCFVVLIAPLFFTETRASVVLLLRPFVFAAPPVPPPPS